MKSYDFCKTGIFALASVGSRLVLYCRKFDSQKNWLPEVWAWWSKTVRCQQCPGLGVEWGSLLSVASALANMFKEARLLLLHCVTGDPRNKRPAPSPTSSTLPGRQLAFRKYLWDEWIENYGKGIKKNKRGLGDRTSRRGLEESRSKEAFMKRWKVKWNSRKYINWSLFQAQGSWNPSHFLGDNTTRSIIVLMFGPWPQFLTQSS